MRRASVRLFCAALMLADSAVFADNAVLTLPGEAKGAAMGEAYSASAGGADAIWYNPAALGKLEIPSLTLMHTAYVDNVTFDTLGVAYPFGSQNALGVGFSYLNVGAIPSFDNVGAAASSYTPKDMVARVGYSKGFEGFSAGLSVFVLRTTIVESASTFGFNLGFRQELGPATLALVAENFGKAVPYGKEAVALPRRIRLGGNYEVFKNLTVSADFFKPMADSFGLGVGSEFRLISNDAFNFALRGGYNTLTGKDVPGLHGVSAGAGVGFRELALNYAWLPFGDLGATHRISVDFQFRDSLFKPSRREDDRDSDDSKPSKRSEASPSKPALSQKFSTNVPLPWKKYTPGARTSKDKMMDLLAKDALCTDTGARAVVTRLGGTADIQTPKNPTRWSRLRPGQFLFEGDTVRTFENSYAHLIFANGAKAQIGANTLFTVDQTPAVCEISRITLQRGEIYAAAQKGKPLEIRTPKGEKRVEDAEMFVTYDGDKVRTETPMNSVPIAKPDKRQTPGRWDADFSKNFERELMRLDSVPGLGLAEYVRDSSLRNNLKMAIFDQGKRELELTAQAEDLKKDVEDFQNLRKGLQSPKISETKPERKERSAELKQATLALKNAQESLKNVQKELKVVVQRMRENQEFLSSVPIVRMLNITAQESTIPFEKGRSVVPEQSAGVLDAISESIKTMKPYRIVVEGHTDKTGSVAANTRLSHQRAEAVARYLSMKTGLPFRSFTIKGVGSAQPIVEGDDPAMMAKNRRVEIWFELRGL